MNSIYETPGEHTINALKMKFGIPHNTLRRDNLHDNATYERPAYIRDIEKIMNIPYYNRYSDKTQVFSFCKNDDISHRSYHVQLVSRIARNIGRMLSLNQDLIEAIALGHDIGHTPFGHAGERFLNEIYYKNTGRYFKHNVHSIRVLDKIFSLNMSLEVLDGILCHNGEFALGEYHPSDMCSFEKFDKKVEECYIDKSAVKRLIPNTIEGCVVRLCDMIAYIGKDRQDAIRLGIIKDESMFSQSRIGRFNAAMINNLVINVVDNSIGRDYIKLDDEHFEALKKAKEENYKFIYNNPKVNKEYDEKIRPMFERVYERLKSDYIKGEEQSVVFRHHINYINRCNQYRRCDDYGNTENADEIVTDFIASMTDDYIIDLYQYLFKENSGAEYLSYFGNH